MNITVNVLVSLVVAIVGAVVYLTTERPKELGRLAFGIGLIVFVWSVSGSTLRLST